MNDIYYLKLQFTLFAKSIMNKPESTLQDIKQKQYHLHQLLREIVWWKSIFDRFTYVVSFLAVGMYLFWYSIFWQSSILVAMTTCILVRTYYFSDVQLQEEFARDCLTQLKHVRVFIEGTQEFDENELQQMIQNYYAACDTYNLVFQLKNN